MAVKMTSILPTADRSAMLSQMFSHVRTLADQSVTMDEKFLNTAVALAWPLISDFAMTILRENIEPELQRSMPQGVGSIRFSEACDVGKVPFEVSRITCLPEQRDTTRAGTVKILRVFMDIRYVGDCHLELVSDAPAHFLQLLHIRKSNLLPNLTVGVGQVKLTGSCVVELFHLLPKPPFAGGIRVHFANRPRIDLEMTGDLKGALNLSFVKMKILEVVEKQFGEMFVLPHRFCVGLRKDVGVFTLKAPRPDLMLRLAVLEVRGLEKAHAPFVSIGFGNHVWKTPASKDTKNPKWDKDNLFGASVCDRDSQRLRIAVHNEERSKIWGSWQGDTLGRCAIVVAVLVNGHRELDTDEFWLVLCESGSQVLNDEKLLSTVDREYTGGLCVKVRLAWRPLLKHNEQAQCLHNETGGSLFEAWSLCPQPSITPHVNTRRDVTCVLLVGVFGAYNLPFKDDMYRKFWYQVSQRGGRLLDVAGHEQEGVDRDRVSKKVIGRGTGGHHEIIGEDDDKCDKCHHATNDGEDDGEDVHVSAMWTDAFAFPLEEPRLAEVTVTVHSIDTRTKETQTLGWMKSKVAPALLEENLYIVCEGVLETAVPEYAQDKKPELRSRRTIVLEVPHLRMLMKLWIVGSHKHHVSRQSWMQSSVA